MSDEEKIAATALATSKQRSLELLLDYTKFHISVYLTLTTSYLTAATVKWGTTPLLHLQMWLVWPAVIAFMVAGLSGGVIASSLTQTIGGGSQDFLDKPIGPWGSKRIYFRARIWTYMEHTSFWIGLICSVLSFVEA